MGRGKILTHIIILNHLKLVKLFNLLGMEALAMVNKR